MVFTADGGDGDGDAVRLGLVHRLDLGALQQPGEEQGVDLGSERGVGQIINITRVVDEILTADHAAEAVPPAGVAHDVDVAVLAGELVPEGGAGECVRAEVAVVREENLAAVGVGQQVLRSAIEGAGEHVLTVLATRELVVIG